MTDPGLPCDRPSRHLGRFLAPAALIAGVALTCLAPAGDRGHAALPLSRVSVARAVPRAPPQIAVLEYCSPFYSFSGGEYLEFEDDAVSETKPPPPGGDAALSILGSYVVRAGRGVRITLGGATHDYALVVLGDGHRCILAAGAANAADLQRSWYGEVEDDAGDDRSPVQRASIS